MAGVAAVVFMFWSKAWSNRVQASPWDNLLLESSRSSGIFQEFSPEPCAVLWAQGTAQPFPLFLAPWDELLERWAGGEH